jgi:formylmethanofuran dehydrogenase subunit E
MSNLNALLAATAARHHAHLCPRQVLGVRIGMYAADLFQLELPQIDKRLFCFVETDGCLTDGIAVATGCEFGRRTMYLMDYGKSAATFVDTLTRCAIRLSPTRESRMRALVYASNTPDRWHAQLEAYKIMPVEELLQTQKVILTCSLDELIGQHGKRVICESCGEDIINQRQVRHGARILCRACANTAYYKAKSAEQF